jgi:hypothetical protein
MANSWNETIADVNKTLAGMNTAISTANGAAEIARNEAQEADTAAATARSAAETATEAATAADAERQKWQGATVEATTLEPGASATISISEKDGRKHFSYGIPRGKDGKDGEKGNVGRSGVTFRLSGTTLYIETE